MTALLAVAATFSAAFVQDKRNNGEEFWKLTDDAPEWMTDIIHAAHGDMLPDDWRYVMIQNVACAIVEALRENADADLDDAMAERIDSLIPIYNRDRLNWLASRLDRAAYCDDARSEGLVPDNADMFDRIAAGMDQEYREIWAAVVQGLRERAGSDANDGEE